MWLCVAEAEYFLSYKDYPFFKEASVSKIYNVELHHGAHLYWPELDVDLNIEILKNPHHFPSIAH